jgi:hypothetical protein
MKAFYLAIPHTYNEQLWQQLQQYTQPDQKLILAKEISKKAHQDISGEHFHVLAEWQTNTYEAFKKSIIEKLYKLCGKAEKGGHRKYGIVRQVRDEDKMLSYTIKGNDYKFQNYTQEEITYAYEQSYEKEDPKAYQDLLMEHLLSRRNYFIKLFSENQGNSINITLIEEEVLRHHMENKDKPICKSKLEYYTNYYLQCIEPNRTSYLEEILIYIKKRI